MVESRSIVHGDFLKTDISFSCNLNYRFYCFCPLNCKGEFWIFLTINSGL